MRKLLSMMTFLVLIGISFSAYASNYDIFVTAAGDRVHGWEKGWSWTATWDDVSANPNQVSHYYDYDNRSGSYRDTYLSFNLTSLAVPVADIISVSFNFNILEIWGSGDIGTLGGFGSGTVSGNDSPGWKSFDITQAFITAFGSGSTTADFSFVHTGQSGFTFSSAEGGNPAFLRIVTAGGSNAVPEPATMLLFGLGMAGLAAGRKFKNRL